MARDYLSTKDMKRGYHHDGVAGQYRCVTCGETFQEGEIYSLGGRYFAAERAVGEHCGREHPDYFRHLVGDGSKYNTLTDNQRQLLELFGQGLPDKEVAKRMGVTPSTVRHQKFMFREKAKQARLYLAVYELALEREGRDATAMAPVHPTARMVDERYVVTEEEREHILSTAFTSFAPLRLGQYSPKAKKQLVILGKIAQQFAPGTRYSEQQVNGILKPIYGDFATLRRYLIEYGFLRRTPDGGEYWLP